MVEDRERIRGSNWIGPDNKMRREELVRKIEEEDLVDDLRALVQQCWDEVERDCEVRRKKRYE